MKTRSDSDDFLREKLFLQKKKRKVPVLLKQT